MDYRIGRSGGVLGSLNYFLEGENLESVYNSAGALVEKYFRGVSVDELVAGYLTDAASGKLTPDLYHQDALTSVSALSGPNGGTLQANSYSAFGSSLATTGGTTSRLQ